MSRGSWRNKLEEEKMVSRIDRGRDGSSHGPRTGAVEEYTKKRLHDCEPGDYVRQVMQGANNYGPMFRVVDPKSGELETRDGRHERMSPRTQVVVAKTY